jgi:hypothetical protein
MARRYLFLSPGEWADLPWDVQQAYVEGLYAEGLLERPEAPLDAGMEVPDDIRSLTAAGTGYRAAEAAPFDLTAMISDLEGRR